MKLLFSSQTYGPLDPQAVRSQRAAIMHAAKHAGVVWMGDCSPDRQAFAVARNRTADAAVNMEECEGVFWCDSDVVLPVDAISRLVSHQKDFVTGIYFQREPPHWPLIATFNEKAKSFNWLVQWPENALAPIDGCGFGCVFTSTRLLRALAPPWFEYKQFSEDFTFCRNASEAGYQLWVDTGVLCGHLPDPEPVTFDTFKNAHPEFYARGEGGPHVSV